MESRSFKVRRQQVGMMQASEGGKANIIIHRFTVAVVVTLASFVVSSSPALGQPSGGGETIDIEGAIRLVESPGGALCSPGTTGPHDAFGTRTIGLILNVEGFNMTQPYDSTGACGDRGVLASQPGTPTFDPTFGCGVIYPMMPPSPFEAFYSVPAQRSDFESLAYKVYVRPPVGNGASVLSFPCRNVTVPPPAAKGPPYTTIPGQDMEMVPAIVRVSYRLEDGNYGSGDTSVWYGYGDSTPYPPGFTAQQIADTYLIDPTVNIYAPSINSYGAETCTVPPSALYSYRFYESGVDYIIVPGGYEMTLNVSAVLPYIHPALGSITVPTRDVIGSVEVGFDIDQNGSRDVIPALGIFSVNVPIAGLRTSCARYLLDVVGETEILTRPSLGGGQPAEFYALPNPYPIFGSINGPTEIIAHGFPKLYPFLSSGGYLQRPEAAAGFPFSGATVYTGPTAISHALDANGYPLTGANASGFDTRPGFPLPGGPVVPDECVDFTVTDTGGPFQPLVITPSLLRGHVLLADGGTPIDQVSQIGPTLLDAVSYLHDDPGITEVVTNQYAWQTLATTVFTNSELPGGIAGGGRAECEAIPPQDTDPISPRYGQPFIDRTNNTSLANFELPALDINVAPAPPIENPWRTDTLNMNLYSGSPDSAADEDFLSEQITYRKRKPSTPNGPPTTISPVFAYPGEVVAGQDFDVCLGLIQITLTETGDDINNPGNPRKFYNPHVDAIALRGYVFGDDDPENVASASAIGGPHVIAGGFGTPLNGNLFLPGTTGYISHNQPAASQGRVNLIVPAGRYSLHGRYDLESGGSTTLTSLSGSFGTIVGCGQAVSISNQLSISAGIPSCTVTGGFTLSGSAFSTPAEPQGPPEIAAAQIVTIQYTVDGGPPVILDPNVHRNPPAPDWGLDPAFSVPVTLPGVSCTPYTIIVTTITQGMVTASTQNLTVFDDSAPPMITLCPAEPILLSACEPGNIPFDLQTLLNDGLLSAEDPNCAGNPLWTFSPNPGSFATGTTTTIQATASDSCGNGAICAFQVTAVAPDCGSHGSCDNGACLCDTGYAGELCDQCAPDYYDYPDCVFCEASTTCSSHGTCGNGGCLCDAGYVGPSCDQCAPDCRVGGGAPKRWPPSAAQTVRAVFPHTAFTKALSVGTPRKESARSS